MFPADKSQGTWKLFDADTKKDIAVDLKYEDYQHIANEAVILCHTLNIVCNFSAFSSTFMLFLL